MRLVLILLVLLSPLFYGVYALRIRTTQIDPHTTVTIQTTDLTAGTLSTTYLNTTTAYVSNSSLETYIDNLYVNATPNVIYVPRGRTFPITPNASDLFYDLDVNRLYYYNDSHWLDLTGAEGSAPSYLFSEDFSGGDKGDFDIEFTSAGCTVTYVGNAANCTIDDAVEGALFKEDFNTKSKLYIKFDFLLPVLPINTDDTARVLRFYGDDDDYMFYVQVRNDGSGYDLRYWDDVNSQSYIDDDRNFQVDTWYTLQVMLQASNTTGAFSVWFETPLEGNVTLSATGIDTLKQGTYINEVWVGNVFSTGQGISVSIDNVIIDDSYIN